MNAPHCRSCGGTLEQVFVDLGASPLSNSYLEADALDRMEPTYPLKAMVCHRCWLVQLPEVVAAREIFSDYAYFSSYSETWLEHCARFADGITARLGLGPGHRVVELASNDGYLLKFFARKGIPVLGVEPAANVAAVAEAQGIPTLVKFFGVATAREMVQAGLTADFLVGNNVLAHVPDLNDFIAGMKQILNPGGVITLEFPHLLRLMASTQFDTIYHEHFSYLNLHPVATAFARHGLEVFDVEELPTHGGSLRVYGQHAGERARPATARVEEVLAAEDRAGCGRIETYAGFQRQVASIKAGLLEFLIAAHREGKLVAGYGAPAKGNTLLNFCGVKTDFLAFTVDRSEHKQGRYLPGSRIPIFPPERIFQEKPDYLLILPWNLKEEIMGQMAGIRTWGGRFVVPVPQLEVLP